MRKRFAQLAIGSMIAVTPFTVAVAPMTIPGLTGTAMADTTSTSTDLIFPILNCNGNGNCCSTPAHVVSGCTPPPCDPNCSTPTTTSGTVATEP